MSFSVLNLASFLPGVSYSLTGFHFQYLLSLRFVVLSEIRHSPAPDFFRGWRSVTLTDYDTFSHVSFSLLCRAVVSFSLVFTCIPVLVHLGNTVVVLLLPGPTLATSVFP